MGKNKYTKDDFNVIGINNLSKLTGISLEYLSDIENNKAMKFLLNQRSISKIKLKGETI